MMILWERSLSLRYAYFWIDDIENEDGSYNCMILDHSANYESELISACIITEDFLYMWN